MSTSRSIALAFALLVGGAIVQALLASTALSQRLARPGADALRTRLRDRRGPEP